MKWDFKYELSLEEFKNYEDLTLTNIKFIKENIKNIDVRFQTFKDVCFQNCKLENVTFDNNFMIHVKFINCELSSVNITESNLSKVMFIHSKDI